MTSGVFHAVLISEISIDRDNRIRKKVEGIEALADSIKRLGLIHPIVISRDNLLIAGERRLTACRGLGWTHINAQYVDEIDPDDWEDIELEENVKRLDIDWLDRHRALMRIHEKHKQRDTKWRDVDTAAIAGEKKKDVVSQHKVVERFIDDPRVRNAKNFSEAHNTATRLAERHDADLMYSPNLGTYTSAPIINSDFLPWSHTYDGPKFNLIHCDFPYGINSDSSGQNPSGYTDTPEIYYNLIRNLCVNLDSFCAESAHIIFWFSPTYFTQTWELLKLLDGFKFDEHPLIWVRDDQRGIAPDAQRRPRRMYETAFFGWRNDRKLVRMKNNAFVGPSPSGDHAHEKSQDALEYFFEMVVDGNTAILDPTCGSGSALRAAKRLGAKQMLGLEINKEFADDALRALLATDDASSS